MNVTVVNLVIDGVAHKLDTGGLCALVSRGGVMPFEQAYEDHDEARRFYATLVGVAYIRTFHKGFMVKP